MLDRVGENSCPEVLPQLVVDGHCAVSVVVKGFDDLYQLNVVTPHYVPKASVPDSFEGLLKVNKVVKQFLLMFEMLLC